MKYFLAIALAVGIVVTPTSTYAQSFNPIQTLTAKLPPPLPSIICPPTTWGWTFCNTIQQQINSYNQQIEVANQITSTMQQFMAYPQVTGSGLGGQISNWNTIVSSAEQGDAAYRSLHSQMFKTNPNGTPVLSPSQLSTAQMDMYGNLHDSIAALLEEDGLIDKQDANDPDVVDMIKEASANAQSPLQVQQMNVQVLGMIYNTMKRDAAETRQAARIQAINALNALAKDQTATAQDHAAAAALAPVVDTSLPTNPH
jgi:hypothetical protein